MRVFQKNCVACGTDLPTPIISLTGVLCANCTKQGYFRKRLVITGITRMNQGRVCVSGVDLDTMRFARPVFAEWLDRDFTMEGTSQVVRHFNIVEMEFKAYTPSPTYHTEDWLINEKFAPRFVRNLTTEEIVRFLERISIKDLVSALNQKDKSLFVIKSPTIQRVWHEESFGKFKVRFTFLDGAGNLFLSIPATDLLILAWVRLHIKNGRDYEAELVRRFNSNPYRYLRVGLTREFQGRHWEQVTALFTIPDLFDGASFATLEKKLGEQV